ncbi:MAG: fibronectin type III domain-containing protein [bacterium]
MFRQTILLLRIFALLLFTSCLSSRDEDLDLSDPIPVIERYYDSSVCPDRIFQSVSEDPSTQINISWRTSENIIDGYAEVAIAGTSAVKEEETDIQKAEVHQVRYENILDHYFKATLLDLKPHTNYMVRVGSKDHRSEWFQVSTAPQSFQPFRFLYFGDIKENIREYAPRIYRQAAIGYPDAKFMVHTGNMVNSAATDDTWGEWFYSGNWLFQQIPSLAVPGDGEHRKISGESANTLFPQWNGSFHFPQNGPPGLKNLSCYYDYPGIRIVSLYTHFPSRNATQDIYLNHEVKVSEEHFQNQLRWLKRILAGNKQPWLVVIMHHPVFTARKDRHNELLQQEILPLLEQYKVDLVLQGHDQVYARGYNPDPERESKLPVYMISVAGGEMQEADKTHNWISRHYENSQLYQVINVSTNTMRIDAVNLQGKRVDRFWIRRDENGTKSLL